MKFFLRRFLLFTAALWLFIGICPLLTLHCTPDAPQAAPTPSASPSPAVSEQPTDCYRILDESDGVVIVVSEADFLPCALLCEMSPDVPEEALKAQAVAIHTSCSRLRQQNRGSTADFSCNTEMHRVYAPAPVLAEKYGEDWETVYAHVKAVCAGIADQHLYYEDALIPAPYFAVSAGCTQSCSDVWGGESLPYLQAVACPSDLLHRDCRAETVCTPESIRAAFPEISFTDNPESWFSAVQANSAGYVKSLRLCGTTLTGTQIRMALSLRSAAFSVIFDGDAFVFSTLGVGHGVGMSQAGAVYMAQNGADYTEILAYFYPGTELK